jgi:Fe-S-cluster containining protein
MQILDNYYALLAKIDELCSGTMSNHAEHISCKRGCSSCCRHLTLFPVEAMAIATALARLQEDKMKAIRERIGAAEASDRCPLLCEDICLLYEARPVICRTHGLPLLLERNEAKEVDCCPLNFKDVGSLPGSAIIDLERLNTLLTAINANFLANISFKWEMQERITMAEALLLDIGEIIPPALL